MLSQDMVRPLPVVGHKAILGAAARLLGYLPEASLGQEAPLADDGDPVAELLDLREEVAGEEDREPLAGELAHQRPDVAHAARVQAVRRLVQDEELRFPEERRRYRQPLLHPLRVRLYLILRPACQVHGLEHPLYRRGLVPARVGGRQEP